MSRARSSSTIASSKRSSGKPPKLPDNFARKLIEREIELDHSPTFAMLNEVINLYRSSIEYYEHTKNPIYIDLQDRMHRLFVRPSILKLLQSENRKLEESQELTLNPPQNQNFLTVPNQDKNRTNWIIDRHEAKNSTNTQKARQDVHVQEFTLKRRLNHRKLHSANSSVDWSYSDTSFTPLNLSFDTMSEHDVIDSKNPQGSEENPSAGFKKHLVNRLEKLHSERARLVSDIKVKYHLEITSITGEVETMGTAKSTLEEKMNMEIESVIENFQQAKGEMIDSLRQQFLTR